MVEGDGVRSLLRRSPAPAGFARCIADLLRAAGEERPGSVRVVRDEGATAVLPDGTELRFASAARRILDALARAHAAGAVGLSVWDLAAQGWPDERIRATAATNRAYVTVNRMRAAGLDDLAVAHRRAALRGPLVRNPRVLPSRCAHALRAAAAHAFFHRAPLPRPSPAARVPRG